MAIPLSFYKFAFPYHSMTLTYKIYGQQPYILEDYFALMFYLLFYKVNVFSYIYMATPCHTNESALPSIVKLFKAHLLISRIFTHIHIFKSQWERGKEKEMRFFNFWHHYEKHR